MQHATRFGTLSVCTMALLAFSGTAAPAQDARAAIETANARFVSLFAQGNAAAVAAMYTQDAQVFPANSDIVSGRAAIEKFWQGTIDAGVKGAKLTTLEVAPSGHIAYEVGRYEMHGQDGKVLDAGKYVVVWKRDRGQWKLHRDIWNTSAPTAGR
jgi:ketosteroid isomerase-like protein